MDGFYPYLAGVNSEDDQAYGTAPGQRPRSRDSLFLLARLRLENGAEPIEVRVRNLSAGGLMAEYHGQVAIGDALKIDLRGIGEVPGRVAWATEGRIGVSLDQPIDPIKARKPVKVRPAR
jgi:hypothetical protein